MISDPSAGGSTAGSTSALGVPPHEDVRPYDASSIRVLKGLQAVRRNPGMYVGSVGADGLHQLAWEVVDNAVDEIRAGQGSRIDVVLHHDGSCSVTDDGRGIPTDRHPTDGRAACEIVLTTLHAGSKFDGSGGSAGLHGVGLSTVNALSSWLHLDVWRDGVHTHQRYVAGEPQSDPTQRDRTASTGSRIHFAPDPTVFDSVVLSADRIAARLQQLSFLCPGLTLRLTDEATGRTEVFASEAGLVGYVGHLARVRTPLHPDAIHLVGRGPDLSVELAVQFTDGYAEEISAFVNRVSTRHGGTHVDGMRQGLTRAIRSFALESGLMAQGQSLHPLDVFEGAVVALAVDMPRPRFDGQIKGRLSTPWVEARIAGLVHDRLLARLRADPALATALVQRALAASNVRHAARRARDAVRVPEVAAGFDEGVYRKQFGIRSKNWHSSCTWLTHGGLLEAHAALADVTPDAQMLDICCGSGVVGAAFDGKVGRKTGLDITPEMVALASERLDEVVHGNVYEMPFDDASFDLVVNREVLHLLPHPEQPVGHVFRVLRPGGQFIVGQILPYSDVDAPWMYRVFKKKQPLIHNLFREADFRQLLLSAGFVDLQMTEIVVPESIDLWIDTHETSALHRHEIRRLFRDAPAEVRRVHPFEIRPDGEIIDHWRWCVFSCRKPPTAGAAVE